jgi:hypothetical protein
LAEEFGEVFAMKIRPSDITKHRHGWLRPDGKFFACARSEHLDLLDDLGMEYISAEKAGWCKIATGLDGKSFFFHDLVINGGEATQAQINAIDRHCAAFKIELPYWAGGN